MDAVVKPDNVKPWPKGPVTDHVHKAPQPVSPRPSRDEAEAAVRTLIAYIGEEVRLGYAMSKDVSLDASADFSRSYYAGESASVRMIAWA